jgi:hypothetical protein
MKRLVNKGQRRLGIPGRPDSIVLAPNMSVELDDIKLKDIASNKTVSRWLETGVLQITDEEGEPQKPPVAPKRKPAPTGIKRSSKQTDVRKEEPLPDGLTGEGVEQNHVGGGWWQVYVNGIKVTDRNVRKDEADEIAKEYE